MFRGEFNHSIDPKGRLIIPAKFREGLGEEFVITKEIGGCLSVYPTDGWKAFEEKLGSLPRSKANIVRFFSGSAVDSGLDKQGRVLLSPALKTYAGLEKEVVLVGVLDRVEIWDKAKWEENNAAAEENIENEMEDLGF
ncbi:division/cell wall cluster transcriptional repressor MraZ [Lachnospiraceae bacterium LCP25S3_G4]